MAAGIDISSLDGYHKCLTQAPTLFLKNIQRAYADIGRVDSKAIQSNVAERLKVKSPGLIKSFKARSTNPGRATDITKIFLDLFTRWKAAPLFEKGGDISGRDGKKLTIWFPAGRTAGGRALYNSAQLEGLKASGRVRIVPTPLVHKTLLDAQLKVLQAQGDAGNYLAAEQAKRLQASNALEEEENALLAIMDDQTRSAEERKNAEAGIIALKQSATAGDAKALDDEHLAILQRQAAAGDYMAAAEVKRLETERQHNQEAAKLLAIINDTHESLENQKRAKAELAQLDAVQGRAIAKTQKDQAVALLQEQAQHGRTLTERTQAERKLAELKIKDAFAQREAEAKAILQSDHATAEQKRNELEMLKQFAGAAGNELSQQLNKNSTPQKHSFDAEERGPLLTGVAAGARAHNRDHQADVAKNTAEAAKLTAELLGEMKEMVRLIGMPKAKRLDVFE